MAEYVAVVFTNAKPGRDDEFNAWYDDRHLDDVFATPGFTGASRYRVVAPEGTEPEHGYLALYNVSGDIDETWRQLKARSAAGELPMTDAFNRIGTRVLHGEEITPYRKAGEPPAG